MTYWVERGPKRHTAVTAVIVQLWFPKISVCCEHCSTIIQPYYSMLSPKSKDFSKRNILQPGLCSSRCCRVPITISFITADLLAKSAQEPSNRGDVKHDRFPHSTTHDMPSSWLQWSRVRGNGGSKQRGTLLLKRSHTAFTNELDAVRGKNVATPLRPSGVAQLGSVPPGPRRLT